MGIITCFTGARPSGTGAGEKRAAMEKWGRLFRSADRRDRRQQVQCRADPERRGGVIGRCDRRIAPAGQLVPSRAKEADVMNGVLSLVEVLVFYQGGVKGGRLSVIAKVDGKSRRWPTPANQGASA